MKASNSVKKKKPKSHILVESSNTFNNKSSFVVLFSAAYLSVCIYHRQYFNYGAFNLNGSNFNEQLLILKVVLNLTGWSSTVLNEASNARA
jgi:hypothetical protein